MAYFICYFGSYEAANSAVLPGQLHPDLGRRGRARTSETSELIWRERGSLRTGEGYYNTTCSLFPMNICKIHTYIHTNVHTYIHACMHACMHAYIHKYINT